MLAHTQYYTEKKMGWFEHWVQTSYGDSVYKIPILLLETNCTSNLSPNQPTTFKTSVRESLQQHFKQNYDALIKADDEPVWLSCAISNT